MAKATEELIQVLKKTARNIDQNNKYQWGHMGACNCGILAQVVTKLTQAEIHRRALERYGDWSEHLTDYCPVNGLPFDAIISELIAFGFDVDDLKHLERLSDPRVLRSIPLKERNLHYNIREDVIKYLNAWTCLLEDELLKDLQPEIPELEFATEV